MVDKKKFKVVGDSKNTFLDITLDVVTKDPEIGDTFSVLGGDFKVTQNGKIIVLVDKDWCLSIMDITPEPESIKDKLVINDTLEIFFETKEVSVKVKCTYEELFYALQKEWKLIELMGHGVMPFEYNTRLKLFTFRDGWGFENGNFSMLSEGSFSRMSVDGRSI